MKIVDFERVMPKYFGIEEMKLHRGHVTWCVVNNLHPDPDPPMAAFNSKGQCFAIDALAYDRNGDIITQGRWKEEDLALDQGA